jgi:PAS domain S-box-containing protein
MDENLYDLPTLQVFVTRAAAEMERRQAQRALQLTQFSVERTREPVYWVAPDGRFIYVNESACRELEYDRTTLLRMSVFDINPGLTETAWNERWRKLKQQGSIQFETRHLRKDGSILPVEIIGNYTHPINLWPTSM